jgi:hypothetical protein
VVTTLAGMVSIPDVPDVSAALLADLLELLDGAPEWAGPAVEPAGEPALLAVFAVWFRLSVRVTTAAAREPTPRSRGHSPLVSC